MMDELWREEEKKTLESIAKLTELGKVKWECVEYNPLCFMNEDKVDETCVREVSASLSQIPVDVEQRTRQTLEVLTQRCPDLPLRQLTEALQELGEHRRQKTLLGCWALSGEPRQCRHMLQLLAEEFFHQEDCLTLDMNVYPFLCGEVLQRLYRQHYPLLCIEHFDDALEELR